MGQLVVFSLLSELSNASPELHQHKCVSEVSAVTYETLLPTANASTQRQGQENDSGRQVCPWNTRWDWVSAEEGT